MNLLNISFLTVAFAIGAAVIYMVVLIMRRWYFNLSPKETASFALIMFLMGFMVSAYLLGNYLYVLLPALVMFAMFGWWVWRVSKRKSLHKQTVKAGMGADSGVR